MATRNKGKLQEIQAALEDLGIRFRSLLEFSDFPEAEESGSTFAENARLKSEHCFRFLHLPALADDSGLRVDALDGAPGIYSQRFAPTDQERIERVLSLLKRKGSPDRRARFVCAMCLYMSDRTIEVEGEVEGVIIDEPRGDKGFGYDPIFYYPPLGKTFAELTTQEKNQVSHRARALHKLREKLIQNWAEISG